MLRSVDRVRLFDSTHEATQSETARTQREEVKRRAAAFDQANQENKALDEASAKLAAQMKSAQAVQAIRYESFRPPGSKWLIEHALSGSDYLYQMIPLRPPALSVKDVINLMIVAMDVVFPRSTQIFYVPPNESIKIKSFYTIKVVGVASLPGWEDACKERALHGLVSINAWP
jgi:hypothetical protein